MLTTCGACKVTYEDAEYSTVCPHDRLPPAGPTYRTGEPRRLTQEDLRNARFGVVQCPLCGGLYDTADDRADCPHKPRDEQVLTSTTPWVRDIEGEPIPTPVADGILRDALRGLIDEWRKVADTAAAHDVAMCTHLLACARRLEVLLGLCPPLAVWTGAGGDARVDNPDNWLNGLAPKPVDDDKDTPQI